MKQLIFRFSPTKKTAFFTSYRFGVVLFLCLTAWACAPKVAPYGASSPSKSKSPTTRNDNPQQQQLAEKAKKKSKAKLIIPSKDPEKFEQQRISQRADMIDNSYKPQYNNPMYFGHKRPPKKNPVGKRKYCKECLMWH